MFEVVSKREKGRRERGRRKGEKERYRIKSIGTELMVNFFLF